MSACFFCQECGTSCDTGASCLASTPSCDDTTATNPCDTCWTCAQNGYCADEWSRCQADTECAATFTCVFACDGTDPNCVPDCWAAHPTGATLYNQVILCITCQSCPTTCDAVGSGCPQ
jgi:hypothetical protein